MLEQIQSFKVIAKGGLNSNRNILDLSDNYPGYGVVLQNFEPSLFGGYRRLEGFLPLQENFPEITNGGDASGKILGVIIFDQDVYAARANLAETAYNIFRFDPGGDWILEAGVPTRNMTVGARVVNKLRYEVFNFDGVEKMVIVDGANPALLYNGTTWQVVASGATGADYANAGGDQIPVTNDPSYVAFWSNTIFLSGFSEAPHVVVNSAPSKEYDWTAAGGGGQIVAGFDVIQMKPWREELYTWGNLKVKKIILNSTADFIIKDVTSDIGCTATDSVQEIGGDIMWLSQDGFRSISGTANIGDVNLASLSKDIQQDLLDVTIPTMLDQIDSVVIRSKSQYRIFFNNPDELTADTHGIIGGLKNSGGSSGAVWEWGRLLGIRTSCCTSGYINNVEFVLHGDYNGKVYRQENGNSFDGNNIHAIYATPFLDFGDTQVRKTLRKISVFLRPEGAVSMDAQLRFDWDNFGILNPPGYILDSLNSPPIWGSVVWGSFNWGNSGFIPVNSSNIEGSCFAVQAIFSTDDISAPYSIQGFVYGFDPDGRK